MEQRINKEKGQRPSPLDQADLADQSTRISKIRSNKVEQLPIDHGIRVERSVEVYEEPQRDRRSIAVFEPIDRPFNYDRDRVTADRSRESTDRSAKLPDAKRHRFLDF